MGQEMRFEPLPPFADPRIALRRALPALQPAEQISVTEAAERSMLVNVAGQWQPFRRDVAPYMVEPTDMVASRSYKSLVFCGASQSGKTQMLMTTVAWSICSSPARVALFQMTREDAAEFERDKISPMVRNSPDIRSRMDKGRGADNQYLKRYVGGTELSLDWPTITKLSGSTIQRVLMTDYDHFPPSIGGEGDGYTMARARARSFMSRGMVVVESSPGAPITNEAWRPTNLHECPPVKYGVLSLYPQGTRARWYWTCPDCGAAFQPAFKLLRYAKSLDPAEAGETAEMQCPHCGVLIGHHMKRDLNSTGQWLHEAQNGRIDGGMVVPIDHPDVRKTDMLSYWMDGAAAAFSTWAELVEQYENAVRHFDATGDEEKLKTAYNTGQAQPYLPRAAADENEITLQGLKDKAQGVSTPKGVAPSWTRFITVSADTQATTFPVQVVAWGDNGWHQIIDRFELHTPPETAPNAADRTIKPFEHAEDWGVLTELENMTWPVEGAGYSLLAMVLTVDMQGGGATTENAYRFYRSRRKAGVADRWYLTRGSGGRHSDRVWLKAPEAVSATARRGRKAASDLKILNIATDRIKDAVATSLRLEAPAHNTCFVPEWMTEAHLTEATAERRTGKGWEPRPGMKRNETLDLLVQARSVFILKGGERINLNSPPDWAIGSVENRFSVADETTAVAPSGRGKVESSNEHTLRRRRVGRMGS